MMLNRWYLSLNDRERILVAIGSAITLILLSLLLVWRPLSNGNQQLESAIRSKTEQLIAMQHTAQQIDRYRQQSTDTQVTGSLQQRVTQSVTGLKISLNRLQSANDETLQLWIDRVEFNSLLRLIDQLSRQGVAIDKLNLQPLPDSGYSKVRLTLVAL